jgi:cellulose synthase/poly-beta-1,6-N-acetylglucosamine synthase-like glycosyltransferase
VYQSETILLWSYVVVGPAAWCLYAYLTTVARSRMRKLIESRATLPIDPPSVTVLVPAKDEGEHIRTCIERVLKLDYPSLNVIAIDDRSEDQTGTVLDEMAGASASLRVVHIGLLPMGWLGKSHALHKAAMTVDSEWLFFVDSDVKLQPDALRRMMALSLDRGYDAVSILTAIETQRFVEKLMLPLLAATWAGVFSADQTNEDSEKEKAVANGQVYLIRTAAYRAVGGHEAVRDRIVEDVELMRLLKLKGFRTRLFSGKELASTRMHTHLKQMFHGWARIFAGTSRKRIVPMIAAIFFLLLCVLSLYVAAAWAMWTMSLPWLVAAAVHAAVMTFMFACVWRWSGNRWAHSLLLPISVPIEIAILIFSIRRALTGQVTWRGNSVTIRETAKN